MGESSKYKAYYEELQNDPLLKQSLVTGTIPLLHIANHEFRDRNKQAELGKKGNIYVETFQIAKDRASNSQSAFRAGHLPEEVLDENQPHKRHAHWLKVRNVPEEGPPLRYGKGMRVENERIVDEVRHGDTKWIDHAAKNTKMLYKPDWKPIQKSKWIDGKSFDLTNILYEGHKSDPPWEEMPLRYNHEGAEYIDSLEKVGEKIYRYRNKLKEGKRPEFIGTIQDDSLGQRHHISQSLRTFMSQKALKVDPTFDEFSKTQRLTFYKESLISTRSIDHSVPFFHSQNNRCSPQKDLMPRSQKIFKLSIKQFCEQEKPLFRHQKPPEIIINQSSISQIDIAKPSSSSQQNTPGILKNNHIKPNYTTAAASQISATPKLSTAKPLSSMHSRSSMGTTNYSQNVQIKSLTSLNKKRVLETNSLQEKMQADPYYLPATQEAKDLVSKYFF